MLVKTKIFFMGLKFIFASFKISVEVVLEGRICNTSIQLCVVPAFSCINRLGGLGKWWVSP